MIQNYTIFRTRLGWMGIAGSEVGISRVILPLESPDDVLTSLGKIKVQLDENAFSDLTQRLMRYFNGENVGFADRLDLSNATTFEKQVWQAAQTITYGQTRGYGWIAQHIGKPNAARAVGQALGRNLIPILIPCHRVIASDGGPGGFSCGINIKQKLLAIEKVKGLSST